MTPAPTDGGSGMCLEDSDCDGGANGRCASEVGNSSVRICSYDQCFADTDCGANEDGGVCECRGPAQPTGPNFCIPSNCREDSDCGECGYCAASPGGCAPNIGIAGWFCGTRLDECAEGSDCGNIPNIYCAFDPLVGYWKCIPADCTG